jgi:hypothetical protein
MFQFSDAREPRSDDRSQPDSLKDLNERPWRARMGSLGWAETIGRRPGEVNRLEGGSRGYPKERGRPKRYPPDPGSFSTRVRSPRYSARGCGCRGVALSG